MGGVSRREIFNDSSAHFVRRMVLSTPPDLVLPLSFVKSRTWLTVSTSEVPQACTVCKNDAWLCVSVVSARSSAAASI